MPQAPILGGEYETRRKPHLEVGSDDEEEEPETVLQKLQPSLAVGYGLGVAISDEGQVRESDNVQGHLGISPKPGLAFGGILFFSDTRDLTTEDPYNLGIGGYARVRFFEADQWTISAYSSLLYAQNQNNATNCDQALFGNEPTNADGSCKVTWNSQALVQLLNLNLSLLLERKLSDRTSVILAPGLVYDRFNSTNHEDGAVDVAMQKDHVFPSAMGFLKLTSRVATFQFGVGATRFTSFNDENARRWVYLGDATISMGLK